MRPGSALFSVVQLLFALMLFALGVVLWVGSFRLDFASRLSIWLTHYPFLLGWIGMGLVSLALGLVSLFYLLYRGCYFSVRTDRGEIEVAPAVLEELVHRCWKGIFPNRSVAPEVRLSGQQIQIIAMIPALEEVEMQITLENAEREIRQLLTGHLGKPVDLAMIIELVPNPVRH